MHATPLIANDIVCSFREARAHLARTLADAGATEVGLWGCGETGEVVLHLLESAGIRVSAVYDSGRRGSFCGREIRDPYRDLEPGEPVIVASAQSPDTLRPVTDYLSARAVMHFCTTGHHAPAEPALARFRNIHAGRRCFVIGNGPSLNAIDMGRLRGEVTFGSNRVYHGFATWGFPFTYWSIEDRLVAEDIRAEWDAVEGPTKLLPADLIALAVNRRNLVPVTFDRQQFDPGLPQFSDDPARLYWGGTVTYLLLQAAVIMGCNPIYLVGVDFHYVRPDHVKALDRPTEWQSHGDDPNHFFPAYFGAGRKWHDPNLERAHRCYQSARNYCDAAGIQVLNATPGSKLDVFPRVEFDQLFPAGACA